MAVSKIIQPTGVAVTISDIGDRPDVRVLINDIDLMADALNAQAVFFLTKTVTIADSAVTTIPLTAGTDYPSGYTVWNAWVKVQSGAQTYSLPVVNNSGGITLHVVSVDNTGVRLNNTGTGWGSCNVYITLLLKKN